MFCTEEGALTTNLVENVWKCHLKFRSKHSNIAGDKWPLPISISSTSGSGAKSIVRKHASANF